MNNTLKHTTHTHTSRLSYAKPESILYQSNNNISSSLSLLTSLYDFFFVIIFISMASIIRKINSFLQRIRKLEDVSTVLEYQSEVHHRQYLRHDNDIDILHDSHKELKGDLRSLQKSHEQMIVSLHNIKQNLFNLREDLSAIQHIKITLDKLESDMAEYEKKLEESREYLHGELIIHDERFINDKKDLTTMYRDIKDDISRLVSK